MRHYEFDTFESFTLAIVALFVGRWTVGRVQVLRRFSIPDSVVGGFAVAAVVALLYYVANVEIAFNLGVRDGLLLYFFAIIGLKSDIKTLISGGKPLVILTLLAAAFILAQNGVAMGTAAAFGLDPKAGLMAGSVTLTGGVGTALAWAPRFVEELGITNALEIGLAGNMLGLIVACVIGGPMASYLIKKHGLSSPNQEHLDIGTTHGQEREAIDAYSLLWVWLWVNVAALIGVQLLDPLFAWLLAPTGLQLPQFVACLMGGILIRNGLRPLFPTLRQPGQEAAGAVFSDICLGMVLTMALMGMRIWELQGLVLFLLVAVGLQAALTVAVALFIVFRAMGRDYESAVICSGFGGITLGSTATAIVNMTAVSKQHGPAHRAFIVVPLVCGFFIDIINAVVVGLFFGL